MRVLLVCPTHYGYAEAIGGAIESLGHTITTLDYFPHRSVSQRVANRFVHEVGPALGAKALLRRRFARFNSRVLEALALTKPEIAIVVKGEILEPETVSCLSTACPTAYWAPDDPYRYSHVMAALSAYRTVASFSQRDVDRLRKDGIDAFYLPNGYSTAVFHGQTLLPVRKRRDACFVGARYPEREALLETLGDEVPLGIWGGDWKRRPWRTRFYGPRTPLDRNTMGWADLSDSAQIYRSCKISVNIHGGDWDGLNTRVFEIPGAGGFQICDMQEGLEEVFEPGKEIVVYRDGSELGELVKHYLSHEREREAIRAAGAARARREHTLAHRMKILLDRATS